MDAENADSAGASVAMEESDVAKQRGEKREREEETERGGGGGGGEEEGQPAAKRPRTAAESGEPGPGPDVSSASGNEQAASEQQPSYAVNSRSEGSMTLFSLQACTPTD